MTPETLRLIGSATNTLITGPEALYIDINTSCNLNCSFCWLHSPLEPTPPKPCNMPYASIKSIISAAARWHAKELVISGDGEPTLHPRFTDIIHDARAKGLTTFLTTNATFPPGLIKIIALIDHLYVNISAPDNALYTQVQSPRNPGLFDRIYHNLKILGQLARRRKGQRLGLACILNKQNMHAVPAMLDLACDVNARSITFRMMEPTPQTRRLLLSSIEKKTLAATAKTLCRKEIPVKHNLKDLREGLLNTGRNPYRIRQCFTGWYNIFVDFNLNVGLCCHNEKLIIGSLKKKTINAVWKSARAHTLRLKCKNAFNISHPPFKGECEWCHWYTANTSIAKNIQRLPHAPRY